MDGGVADTARANTGSLPPVSFTGKKTPPVINTKIRSVTWSRWLIGGSSNYTNGSLVSAVGTGTRHTLRLKSENANPEIRVENHVRLFGK